MCDSTEQFLRRGQETRPVHCTEVQNDRFSSGEFYKLDLNRNELLKLISPFSSPNEPNFLQ